MLKLAAIIALVLVATPQKLPDAWEVVILGIAQDGGMPHPGCTKPPCSEVFTGERKAEKVSCIGLINRGTGHAYMIDATPDFPEQLYKLTRGQLPDGIFLTHAHIGHYTGLMYLGKEAMSAQDVPVYGTARMVAFLRSNAPWKLLIEDRHIEPRTMLPDQTIKLPGGLRVTPLVVPHRDEFTDTVGYLIEGPRASVLFIPDIDKWEKWDKSLRELANRVDMVLVDGTFSSLSELTTRDISQVPHPLMSETRALLRGTRAKLWFIHLNHSNPELVDGKDVVREGMSFPL
jgi:pyrroloquinoline quinone biosynthesis protein B